MSLSSKAIQHKSLALSFSGAGHLLPYHLGVASSILQHMSYHKNETSKKNNSNKGYESSPILPIKAVFGSSSGAIAAVAFAKIPHRIEEFADRFITSRGKAFEILSSMLYDEERHWSTTNTTTDTDTTKSINNTSLDQRILKGPPTLFIAVTKCKDGSPHLFRFCNNQIFSTISSSWNTDGILKAVKASCTIPASFHPADIFPGFWDQSVKYPDDEGIYIDGCSYVDGGIASPAPISPTVNSESTAGPSKSKTLIISPIAFSGTPRLNDNTCRISPNDNSLRLLPFQNIKCRNDFIVKPSIQNMRALRIASGAASSAELLQWYERGIEDAIDNIHLMK